MKTLEQLKADYGDEYPQAVTFDGVRMALSREREFSRVYTTPDGKSSFVQSRFVDGSASITLREVEERWPGWSGHERLDFCNAVRSSDGLDDLPGILRFVMREGEPTYVSTVASSVARSLPREEAFALLCDALQKASGEHTANLTQAVSHTKHPGAEKVLLEHLDALWGKSDLWDDDSFVNWRAYDVTCCIKHLLELGATPALFEEKVRRLAAHVCEHNRDSCSMYLQKHYDWLPAYERPKHV
jgi:hypothetical protein